MLLLSIQVSTVSAWPGPACGTGWGQGAGLGHEGQEAEFSEAVTASVSAHHTAGTVRYTPSTPFASQNPARRYTLFMHFMEEKTGAQKAEMTHPES